MSLFCNPSAPERDLFGGGDLIKHHSSRSTISNGSDCFPRTKWERNFIAYQRIYEVDSSNCPATKALFTYLVSCLIRMDLILSDSFANLI